jgi:hypothetical protein
MHAASGGQKQNRNAARAVTHHFPLSGAEVSVQSVAMSQNPNPNLNSVPGAAFARIFGAGAITWLAGMVLLFGVATWVVKAEPTAIALLWAISHSWIAYFFGLLVMVVVGLVTSRSALAKSIVAYVLPAGVLAGLAAACVAVYPDASLRSDLVTFLPVILVFYLAGWVWLLLKKNPAEGQTSLRAVIPSLLGGLVVFGMIAVPAFASDDFRYHKAFQVKTRSVSIQDGALIFEGTLVVTKPGNYRFVAPRYLYGMEGSYDQEAELGDIQWGEAGSPEKGGEGSFPLRITWKRGILPGHTPDMFSYEGAVTLDVHNRDEDDKRVYSMVVGMQTTQ